jgi:hypothetical protein
LSYFRDIGETQVRFDLWLSLLNVSIIGIRREDFIVPDPRMRAIYDQAMLAREGEYTRKQPIKICVGTWNVNGGQNFRSVALKVGGGMIDKIFQSLSIIDTESTEVLFFFVDVAYKHE